MIRTSLILAATLIAAGCTGADIPPVEPAAGVAIPVDFLADTRPEAGLDDVWWHGFDEPELNALVEAALLRNQSLEAARQRLVAARALVRAEQSDFAPTVDMLGTSDLDLDDAGSVLDGAGASIGGVWTIDINGRLSAELAAAVANADGAMHFVADRRRLIAAAVASQYIELKRTAARLQLLDQSTDLQRQTLNIVTLRFEAGLSANLDVRRAAADLARTQAQRGALVLARARAANALAVLTGSPPVPIPPAAEDAQVPAYERGPELGLPASLLRRRPDLLLAEADIAVAAANVGIERADLVPAFAIPGLLTLGDGTFGGLFSQAIAGLSAVLDVPVFDAGRRRAEIDVALSLLEAETATYRETLLTVLAEVETALVAIDAAADRTDEFASAVTESEAAFDQSNALYREGLASLFDVLDVQRQLIGSREALIDGNADLAQAYIDLFAAIGSETGNVDVRSR